MDTLAAKQAFAKDAAARELLALFEHDPRIAAGYLREEHGKRVGETLSDPVILRMIGGVFEG